MKIIFLRYFFCLWVHKGGHSPQTQTQTRGAPDEWLMPKCSCEYCAHDKKIWAKFWPILQKIKIAKNENENFCKFLLFSTIQYNYFLAPGQLFTLDLFFSILNHLHAIS
jgi:hypothetical protein